jgi:hypothetical protein
MNRGTLRKQRLLALFALGVLALNFPLITLWDREITLWGLPLMPLALFAGWAALIGAAAWVAEGRGAPKDDGGADAGGPDP